MSRALLRSISAASAGLRASPVQIYLRSSISTLSSNPHIKVFPNEPTPGTNLLTYLDTPTPSLSIGTSTALPPTPRSFSENRAFLRILNRVLEENAHLDPDLISQARAFAGPGAPLTQQHQSSKEKMRGDGSAGGASGQGGAGGAGMGGYVHLSDARNPPDFGRIAWPEDILGSVEVNASGEIVGRLEPSGTYRILTNEGILGLSPFLRKKLVERLQEEAKKAAEAEYYEVK